MNWVTSPPLLPRAPRLRRGGPNGADAWIEPRRFARISKAFASVERTAVRPVHMENRHVDRLEQELAELTTRLESGTHRQLTILRELEPTGFWAEQGASSFAHWLSWRIGLAPGAAREKIRV